METIQKLLIQKNSKPETETGSFHLVEKKLTTSRLTNNLKLKFETPQSSFHDQDLVYVSDASETDSGEESSERYCDCCSHFTDHTYAQCSLLEPARRAKAAKISINTHQIGKDAQKGSTHFQTSDSDNGERVMALDPGLKMLNDPLVRSEYIDESMLEESHYEILPQDPACELRIDSVYSLASDCASKDNEGETNAMIQALTVSLKDPNWERICKTCFVVLDRMPLSHLNKTERDKATSHCSPYCRLRTLNLMCSMNLLMCCHHTVERDNGEKGDESLPLNTSPSSRPSKAENDAIVTTVIDNSDVSFGAASSSTKVDPKNLDKKLQWQSSEKNARNETDTSDYVKFLIDCAHLKHQIELKRKSMHAQKVIRKFKKHADRPKKKFPPTIRGIPVNPVTLLKLKSLFMPLKSSSHQVKEKNSIVSTAPAHGLLSKCLTNSLISRPQSAGSNSVSSAKQAESATLPKNPKEKPIILAIPVQSCTSAQYPPTPSSTTSTPSTMIASKLSPPPVQTHATPNSLASNMLSFLSTQHQLTSLSSHKTLSSHPPKCNKPSTIIVHRKMGAKCNDSASKTLQLDSLSFQNLSFSLPSSSHILKPSTLVAQIPSSTTVNTNARSEASVTKTLSSLANYHLSPSHKQTLGQTPGSALPSTVMIQKPSTSTVNMSAISNASASKSNLLTTQIQLTASTSNNQSFGQPPSTNAHPATVFIQKPSSSTVQMNTTSYDSASKTLRDLSAQIELSPITSKKKRLRQPPVNTKQSTMSAGKPLSSTGKQSRKTSLLPTILPALPASTSSLVAKVHISPSLSAEPVSRVKLKAALKSVSDFVKSNPEQLKTGKSNNFLIKIGDQQVLVTTGVNTTGTKIQDKSRSAVVINGEGHSTEIAKDVASASHESTLNPPDESNETFEKTSQKMNSTVKANVSSQVSKQSNQSQISTLPGGLAELKQTGRICNDNQTALPTEESANTTSSPCPPIIISPEELKRFMHTKISPKIRTGKAKASNLQLISSCQSGVSLLPVALAPWKPSSSSSSENVTRNITDTTDLCPSSQPQITPTEALEGLILPNISNQKNFAGEASTSSLQQTTTCQPSGISLLPIAAAQSNPSGSVSLNKNNTMNTFLSTSSTQPLIASKSKERTLLFHKITGEVSASTNLQQTLQVSHQSKISSSPVLLAHLNQTGSLCNEDLTSFKTKKAVEVASTSTAPTLKRRFTELSQEDIRIRKRKKLEEKYPLPPGVIIKAEPLTDGYELDNNWSVTSEVDTGYIPNNTVINFSGSDAVIIGQGFDDDEDNRYASFQEDSSGEIDDLPPVLDSVTHWTSDNEFNEAPPTLQPIPPSLPSLSFTDIPELGEEDGVISSPDNEADTHKDGLPQGSRIITESPAGMSHSESGYNSLSGSSSSEALDWSQSPASGPPHASSQPGQEIPAPRSSGSRLQQLKELLKKKEMQVENMRRIRSAMPQIDLESV